MNKIKVRIPNAVEIDQSTYSSTSGKLSLGPLEKGYGLTLGNSLRRALLNALPGAAITSLKIDGINHEFTTIKGVMEDVSEIILNLKEIRVKMLNGTIEKVSIGLKGKKEFKGSDIQKNSSNLEVLNPDHHIATLNEDSDFTIELRIERGRGYNSADKNKKPDAPLGTIFMDSIFTPIKFVKYEVEPARVEGKTDFEKLIIDVETDGSVTPDDAVSQAAIVLRDHLNLFITSDSEDRVEEPREEEEDIAGIRKQLLRSIDELELSVRSHNCLKAAQIDTLGDLVSKSEQEMLKFKNFGRKSLLELQQKLGELGLAFDMDVMKYIGNDEF
ncbi:MAG: DNA-directed RNA polymerase subunit alpha [Candidatus Marinimicrobia bacterium]|nr:DNA-directed RNA polymerase subunit alpha [Candidatus Neomarinimicrobiota bacterium]